MECCSLIWSHCAVGVRGWLAASSSQVDTGCGSLVMADTAGTAAIAAGSASDIGGFGSLVARSKNVKEFQQGRVKDMSKSEVHTPKIYAIAMYTKK